MSQAHIIRCDVCGETIDDSDAATDDGCVEISLAFATPRTPIEDAHSVGMPQHAHTGCAHRVADLIETHAPSLAYRFREAAARCEEESALEVGER